MAVPTSKISPYNNVSLSLVNSAIKCLFPFRINPKTFDLSCTQDTNYSRTSVAQTLLARLPQLFQTRTLESLGKNPLAADLG